MTYPLMKLDDKQMLDILAAARQQGITTMVHAENSEIISKQGVSPSIASSA
jgi:dihydropyrimidinase